LQVSKDLEGNFPVKLSFVIPLAVVTILSLSKSAWAGKLIYWKFDKSLGRIELITEDGIQPQATFLADPARVIIDLPNTRVDKSKQRKRQKVTQFIRDIRVGQFTPQTARFVIELGRKYTLDASKIEVRSLAPNRWFVQLPKFLPRDSVPSQSRDPIAIDVPRGKVALPPPTEISVPSSIPPAAPLPPLNKGSLIVVIDPGHGGRDPGAIGNGLQEKEIVHDVSLQVAEQLRRNGIRVVLTRSGDQEVDLEPRVAKAEGVRANLFVSIHANAISMRRPEINGLETYYYASRQGYRLAQATHSSLLREMNLRDRGIRQARFYVIRRTSMPAVLIEIGYITGSQDSIKLASAAERTKIAEAISQGILNYFQRK
jgi:N-acetylmuramoyl-L-alanine amidase